jgi:3-dehydroquinate dehydratase-2
MRILVLNGPNLNLLGTRRPDIYGTTTLGELEANCRAWGSDLGLVIETIQSNHEGALVDALHDAIGRCDGAVINPGALAHYSYVLHDAIEALPYPVIEVHISDITAREAWRASSVVAPACAGSVIGRGVDGYREALQMLEAMRRET